MTTPLTADALSEALIAELATAIDGMVGGVVATPSDTSVAGDGWRLIGAIAGEKRGTLTAWIDLGGAERLARRATATEAPDQAAIAALLRDLWSQAAAGMARTPAYAGVTVSFGTAESTVAPERAVVYDLRTGDRVARVAVAGQFDADAADGIDARRDNLDVVLDIDLPLVVRFARTTMSIRALSALGPGSIVDMERSPDEPVQVLVGDRVIARGEVVVVGGNYGVRITELMGASERARELEA
jgi:flagellar motor switch protein FliN/FliY